MIFIALLLRAFLLLFCCRFTQNANMIHITLFFGLRLIFFQIFPLRTNKSSSHDSCAEQMSCLPQQHQQRWLTSSLSVSLSTECCFTNETQRIKTIFADNIRQSIDRWTSWTSWTSLVVAALLSSMRRWHVSLKLSYQYPKICVEPAVVQFQLIQGVCSFVLLCFCCKFLSYVTSQHCTIQSFSCR